MMHRGWEIIRCNEITDIKRGTLKKENIRILLEQQFIPLITTATYWSLHWTKEFSTQPPQHVSKIYFNIIIPLTSRSPKYYQQSKNLSFRRCVLRILPHFTILRKCRYDQKWRSPSLHNPLHPVVISPSHVPIFNSAPSSTTPTMLLS